MENIMPANKTTTDSTLTLDIHTEDLSKQQVRLVKTINTLLAHVLTTDQEDEYFESSSELLRVVATAIKKSNFSEENQKPIEYGQQALEFCVDILNDQIYEGDLIKYDN
jgi:hypothetical protein